MITSAEEFVFLLESEEKALYSRAAHDSAPEDIWFEVITSYPTTKRWVAHNKTVPLTILRMLAKDEDSSVRVTVAMKRKLDLELFTLLSKDSDSTVRLQVALNKSTPIEVLQMMKNDEWDRINDVLEQRLGNSES